MKAIVIPGKQINSENGIVNLALETLGTEEATFPEKPNVVWLKYLVQENKLDAFNHPRLYFQFTSWTEEEGNFFLDNAKQQDFQIINVGETTYIKASLLAWVRDIDYFKEHKKEEIIYNIWYWYPNVAEEFKLPKEEVFRYESGIIHLSEEYVFLLTRRHKELFKLAQATVLVAEENIKKYFTMSLDSWAGWITAGWDLCIDKATRHCAFQLASSLARAFPEWAKVYDMARIISSQEGY